ncbi:MAG: ferritin family protein, partial [Promethearchaeota archaeon]
MNKLIEQLAQAYVGESQARMRYTEYAKIAKKEG